MAFPEAGGPAPKLKLTSKRALSEQFSGCALPSELNCRGWNIWPPREVSALPAGGEISLGYGGQGGGGRTDGVPVPEIGCLVCGRVEEGEDAFGLGVAAVSGEDLARPWSLDCF